MRVVIEPTAKAVSRNAAGRLAALVRSRPDCVLGLATGQTMVEVYRELVRRHREDGLSLGGVKTFNLDEYVGVAPEDPRSFHHFMLRHLVAPTDLRPEAAHVPDGHASDLFAEAERYEGAIAEAGGLDLQLLGLGRNGHLGFNEPGSSLKSLTRVKALTRETLEANREDLGAEQHAPPSPNAAITMGLGTILSARACILLALGEAKADAVVAMIEGPVTARLPASALQMHRDVVVLLDEPAASKLANREYYLRAEELQRQLEGG